MPPLPNAFRCPERSVTCLYCTLPPVSVLSWLFLCTSFASSKASPLCGLSLHILVSLTGCYALQLAAQTLRPLTNSSIVGGWVTQKVPISRRLGSTLDTTAPLPDVMYISPPGCLEFSLRPHSQSFFSVVDIEGITDSKGRDYIPDNTNHGGTYQVDNSQCFPRKATKWNKDIPCLTRRMLATQRTP